jgi:hypothetical protein
MEDLQTQNDSVRNHALVSMTRVWAARSVELAEYTLLNLANRTDFHGAYTHEGNRYVRKKTLTPKIVQTHYSATSPAHIVGLHDIAPENSCRWIALDFDHHDDIIPPPPGLWAMATAKFDKLRLLGFHPLLTSESEDFRGGHLRVIFKNPIPSDLARSFGLSLTADYEAFGLPGPPESFPKLYRLNDDTKFGYWLRLFGPRHHKRDAHSRVWDSRNGWLEGDGAIDRILECEGDDEDLIPEEVLAGAAADVSQERNGKHLTIEDAREIFSGVHAGNRHTAIGKAIGLFLSRVPDHLNDHVLLNALLTLAHGQNQLNKPEPKPEKEVDEWFTDLLKKERAKRQQAEFDRLNLYTALGIQAPLPNGEQDETRLAGKGDAYEPPTSEQAITADDPFPVGQPPNSQPSSHSLPVVRMDSVVKKPVNWLWPARIPRGAITLVDGDPDLGKSFVALDIAARETTGSPMPNESYRMAPRKPGAVLIMNGEDDLERTIRPRLDILGADCSRVWSFNFVLDSANTKRPPMLPTDLHLIEGLIAKHKITLAIVDPFMAYLDGDQIDSHKDSDVRKLMHQIRDLAERTQIAFLIIRHLNKMISVPEAMYRGGGSIGIIGAARSALLVAKHPDDEDLRILARIKGNLCAPPESLQYRLVVEGDMARVAWEGAANIDPKTLLERNKDKDREEKASRKVKGNGSKILNALDSVDPQQKGVTRKKLHEHCPGIGRTGFDQAIADLMKDGVLECAPVTYTSGRNRQETTEGIRRRKNRCEF